MSDDRDDSEFEDLDFEDLGDPDDSVRDQSELNDLIYVDEYDIRTTYPDDHQCPFCRRALRDDDPTVCKCRHCVCRWCADCNRTRDIGAICQLCGMIEFESNDRGTRAPLLPEWRDKF